MTAPGRPDARAAERVPLLGEMPGEVMVFQPMAIREISPSGAQIETTFPLQINTLHQLRLELGGRSVVASGRVAHCRISDVDQETVLYCSGIEFVERSQRLDASLEVFLEDLKRGRDTPPAR